ncbi:FimV/HubP family polar landmark protein [Oceanimonas sp. CHS3-5]|uniref:FimV/HubP family polar landmark protein n=1 Tax=Oceanimonas sp. CHS3-5 TaxID=3068186 RepID=UPI00273F262D|nr:FimV/HubP family polar landmark protein [Oceanimonas sp. CHS3-5]MDP5291407.1 FimV/HubP family polar landmark protein [Oceanimonas sp. CHS3-5]
MRTRRPPLYSVLALWLSCTLSATAQEFYIELRGPDTPAALSPAAPEQPAPVQASRYGPITSTDTLWSIAARHTRAPATVQQTMVALYYLNPTAFVRGNINYLQRGAMLRLPTLSQARQRTPREAENEFRRLSRQGNRSVTQAPARPAVRAPDTPQPSPAPAVATPPAVKAEPAPVTPPAAEPKPEPAPEVAPTPATPPENVAQAPGLSEPRAARPAPAPVSRPEPETAQTDPAPPVPATGPERAEQAALERLQARLLDELREQVAMSNEQLAQLADNNQALRRRLGQLTAEVNELKMVRAQQATPEANAAVERGGWFSQLLEQPLNLALLLTLPALLLLALFTLWWRKRLREDMAEQDADSSQLMMEDEQNDFDDLFATELSAVDEVPPTATAEEEVEIDEDAFARFLEEQERQEQEDAEPAAAEVALDEALFDDQAKAEPSDEDILFDDEAAGTNAQPAADPDELLFDDEAAGANPQPAADPDELLFDDEAAGANPQPAADADELLFDDEAAGANAQPTADVDELLFDDEAAGANAQATADADDVLFDDAVNNPNADLSLDETPDQPLFGNNSGEADLAFDDSLFDLDAPEEATPQTDAAEEPVSLAEQGAFDEDLSSRFDDVLADSMAEQSAEPAAAGPDESSSFLGEREPVARHELDDYAELLGNGQEVDIDLDEGGMGAKLDLARAYIEIDDLDSARELLNEALEKGNEQQQNDARKLLQRLGKR